MLGIIIRFHQNVQQKVLSTLWHRGETDPEQIPHVASLEILGKHVR